MNRLLECSVSGRIAVERARLSLPFGTSSAAREHFVRSARAAFPELSGAQAAALYVRHRLSMRKFALIKRHLAALPLEGLNAFLERHVQVDGQAHLDAVRQSEGPVIFVTPHYGNFPAGCLKLIKEIGRHKTVNAFYNPPSTNRSSEGFEQLFQRLGYGFHALFNDDSAVLKALRVLKRGEALTMMPDVFDISGHVLYVPFFGRLVPAMAGTALFALKGRAQVIVGYNCPGEGLSSTLKLGAPLAIERTGELEADIATLTAAIFRELEAQIRSAPEHWIYLPEMHRLLAERLPVSATTSDEWLRDLDASTRRFSAVLPEWPAILDELRAMPLAIPFDNASSPKVVC